MTSTLFDILLGLLLVGYAITGYRRGLLLTLASTVGFVLGAVVAVWFGPGLLARLDASGRFENGPASALLLVVLVLVLGTLGQAIFARIGWPLRRRAHRIGAGPIDSLLGGLLTVVVAVLTVWFAAGLLRVGSPGGLGHVVAQSRVLAAIDRVIPPSTDRVLGRVLVTLDRYGVPRVFDGLSAEPITPVAPADAAAASTGPVRAAGASILRIDALAISCGRSQEGTGWVAGPGLVVTNAHVVAGAEQVTVTTPQGRRTRAEVVAFDPDRDLAVLSVGRLQSQSQPLRLGAALEHGDEAVVAGYPGGGPYRVAAARVRGALSARGDDIYGAMGVTRKLYALRVDVHPGNSGGPLLRTDGTVAGVVFARSVDDPHTAYALRLDELRPVLAAAPGPGGGPGPGRPPPARLPPAAPR
ncbi:MAG: MarP family serine protease, partial [Micrococcales bacterium]|nr:MarP family serine protease [Micrococcales bacterium]